MSRVEAPSYFGNKQAKPPQVVVSLSAWVANDKQRNENSLPRFQGLFGVGETRERDMTALMNDCPIEWTQTAAVSMREAPPSRTKRSCVQNVVAIRHRFPCFSTPGTLKVFAMNLKVEGASNVVGPGKLPGTWRHRCHVSLRPRPSCDLSRG